MMIGSEKVAFRNVLLRCFIALLGLTAGCASTSASSPGADLRRAASVGDLQGVRDLLEQGADVEYHQSDSRRTPLIEASAAGHEAIVRSLLEAGAGVDRSTYSRTALIEASAAGHEAIVRMLLEAGARVSAQRGEALRLATLSGHDGVIEVLRAAGAMTLDELRAEESALKAARLAKLDLYEVGITTLSEFNDDWDWVATVSGFVGIVLINGDGRTITYTLGTRRSSLAGLGLGLGERPEVMEMAALMGTPAKMSDNTIQVHCELTFSIFDDRKLVNTTCE